MFAVPRRVLLAWVTFLALGAALFTVWPWPMVAAYGEPVPTLAGPYSAAGLSRWLAGAGEAGRDLFQWAQLVALVACVTTLLLGVIAAIRGHRKL